MASRPGSAMKKVLTALPSLLQSLAAQLLLMLSVLLGGAIREHFGLLDLVESAWGSGSGDTLRMSSVHLSTTQP